MSENPSGLAIAERPKTKPKEIKDLREPADVGNKMSTVTKRALQAPQRPRMSAGGMGTYESDRALLARMHEGDEKRAARKANKQENNDLKVSEQRDATRTEKLLEQVRARLDKLKVRNANIPLNPALNET